MRINPLIHEHRKSAIQDVARKAGASKNTLFQELRRHEGAESALKDAIAAIEACKADVRKQAETDGNVDAARGKMACFDESVRVVSNLRDTAHVSVLLLTGKLAQAEEHLQHCEALFNDEQRILDAYAAAMNEPQPVQDVPDADDAGGVTPKAPPRLIPAADQQAQATVGPPVAEDMGEPTPEEAAVFPGEHVARVTSAVDGSATDGDSADSADASSGNTVDDVVESYTRQSDTDLVKSIPEFPPASFREKHQHHKVGDMFTDEGEDATDEDGDAPDGDDK